MNGLISVNEIREAYPLLSTNENNKLASLAKTNTDALEKLFYSNIDMIFKMIGNHKSKYVEYEDLFQNASLALVEAVKAYDESLGNFSTFLGYYINGYSLKLKTSMSPYKYYLTQKNGRILSVCKKAYERRSSGEISEKELQKILRTENISNHEYSKCIRCLQDHMEFITEKYMEEPFSVDDGYAASVKTEFWNNVNEIMDETLTKKQKRIFAFYYENNLTCCEIAKMLNITQQGVSAALNQSRNKFRKSKQLKKIMNALEDR